MTVTKKTTSPAAEALKAALAAKNSSAPAGGKKLPAGPVGHKSRKVY